MSTSSPRFAAISHSSFTDRGAVRHGALEMRNAADDIDAHVERPHQVLARLRASARAVLREGHELQVDIGRDLLLHLEEGLDGEQPVVADIDMAADRQRPLRDGQSQ